MKRIGWALWIVLFLAASATAADREAQYQAAKNLYDANQYSKARDAFKRLWAFDKSGDVRIALMLGQCEEKLGRYAEARKYYQEVLESNPQNPTARTLLNRLDKVAPAATVTGGFSDSESRRPMETPAIDNLIEQDRQRKEEARRQEEREYWERVAQEKERQADYLRQLYRDRTMMESYEYQQELNRRQMERLWRTPVPVTPVRPYRQWEIQRYEIQRYTR
ncbi:MAG: tetratricopeptide repeat protein [Thermodesulfobacteriota bacterium]